MTLSPVLHIASGQWMLGQIENHAARPLTRDEIEAHIKEFDEVKSAFERQRRNYIQLYYSVIGEGCTTSDVKDIDAIAKAHREDYHELIMAISSKFPNETRHQTALRYIMEREAASSVAGSSKAAEPSTPPPSASGTVETQGADAVESQGTPAS